MASKFIGDHHGDGSNLTNVNANLLDSRNYTDFVQQLGITTNPNYQTPSSRRLDPNAGNPTNAHYAAVTFGNGGNVTGQIATHFQTGEMYTRGYNSSWSGWRKQWDSSNDGSGSGLDADLLDGIQSTSFLRSDANDTATGNITFLNDAGINIRTTTNAAGAKIKFSDLTSGYTQAGTLEYVHSDTLSYGSGNAFKFYGTEASMSFHVAGTGLFTGDLTAYYSDERLKDFSGKIENALDKVCSLNGYYYTGNNTAGDLGYDTDVQQVGVSAQEVQAVLPEIVKDAPINADNGTDYMTVQYERMAPMFIEAIKELKDEVASLKAEIAELKK